MEDMEDVICELNNRAEDQETLSDSFCLSKDMTSQERKLKWELMLDKILGEKVMNKYDEEDWGF